MLRARVSASRNRKFALIANSAALVAPPDSAVRGGSLNGRLQPPIGGGSATARLTRREDDAVFGGAVTGDVVLSIVLIVAGIVLTLRARP